MMYAFDEHGKLIELGTGRVIVNLEDEGEYIEMKKLQPRKYDPGAGVRRMADMVRIESKKQFSIWGWR